MPTKKQKQNKMKKGSPNPLVWAEIPVTDLDRAKDFYAKTFGFKYQMHNTPEFKMAMFPSAGEKAYGAGGALMLMPGGYTPSHQGPLVYFHSDDIPKTLEKAEKAGGKVLQGKKSIGQYGFIAFFEDSEGNRVALHSMN